MLDYAIEIMEEWLEIDALDFKSIFADVKERDKYLAAQLEQKNKWDEIIVQNPTVNRVQLTLNRSFTEDTEKLREFVGSGRRGAVRIVKTNLGESSSLQMIKTAGHANMILIERLGSKVSQQELNTLVRNVVRKGVVVSGLRVFGEDGVCIRVFVFSPLYLRE